jgi:O-antigen ligase
MDPGAVDMTEIADPPWGQCLQGFLDRLNVLNGARCLTAVATLLLVLVTLEPFIDLGSTDITAFASGRTAITYICFGALAAVAVLLSASENAPALKTLWTPLHLCFIGWMAVNIAFSENPGLSLQRFALTVTVASLAIMMSLLPPSQKYFNQCFGAATIFLLALCYLGIILAPEVSIHSAADIAEPFLAGDWRGSFAHKNIAAPVMTILVYLGIYLASTGAFLAGPAVVILAGIFLGFTEGKTSTALCLVIYALASLVCVTKSLWLKRAICFVPLVMANLLTLGSVVSEGLANLTKQLPVDSTFTGRTDIWEFALAAVREKPILGHGYAAFWDNVTSRQTFSGAEWAVSAAHSHNSYLDLAVTIGLPGLLLTILIFVLAPLGNFQTIQAHGGSSPLAKFFLTIWLFGLYYGTTETFLLDRQNPTWFMFVVAVAGLHFLARFPVREENATASDN